MKKLDELNNPPKIQPNEEEQIRILDEFTNDQRRDIESLRKMLSNLKEEFGE